MAITEDILPPQGVTNPKAESSEEKIRLTWEYSGETSDDFAGFRVWFGNDAEGTDLPPDRLFFEKSGLEPATAYLAEVAAYDNDGNESERKSITGVTWLPNPANLTAVPGDGYVMLTWEYDAALAEYLKDYRVYMSETDFSEIGEMTPEEITFSKSARIGNLTNRTTYYFAVTAVNISDGERTDVTPVMATPLSDTEGPEISEVMMGNEPLADGHILFKTETVTLKATDSSGISHTEFHIGETLVCTDYEGISDTYSCEAEISGLAYGDYVLKISAYDIAGNKTTATYDITVGELPPFGCFHDCN
jgi:hypothetical protein